MFIFLESDSFQAQFDKKAEQENLLNPISGSRSPQSVRRPYRGIQIKDDTYATLSVVKADGTAIPLTSSSAEVSGAAGKEGKNRNRGLVDEYSDFIIQSLDDQRVEKQQIIETFGQPYIYFFGERPRMINFSGLLMNTEDFNWRSQFWFNYENHLRGTKLVQANARVYLSFDTILVEGYPLSATARDVSDMPYSIPFSMQMFVTNYYDFSQIGQTRFPGNAQVDDLETLNDELRARRGTFVSRGAAVRKANLEARGAGGILASLRAGLRGLNELKTIAGGYLQTASQVLGGRTVRVPLGVAGFLATTGEATFAAGSTGNVSTNEGTLQRFDARTGRFENVSGSVKIRAPAAAQFAPSWVSAVDGRSRGFIWENIDEYPNRAQPKRLANISQAAAFAQTAGLEARQAAGLHADARLEAKVVELTGDGGTLQSLTERVDFAKSNFGMVMNAAAFVRDPVSVGKKLVGITSDRNVIEELQKRGVKIAPLIPGKVESFIGSQALNTFQGTADSIAGGAEEVATGLGAAYEQAAYGLGSDNEYENVYGNQDYTALVATDPSTQSALTEAFGDSDAAPEGSEIDPDSFSEVFGADTSTPAAPTDSEKAIAATANQLGIAPPNDSDTIGIRGVGSDDAPIDAVV